MSEEHVLTAIFAIGFEKGRIPNVVLKRVHLVRIYLIMFIIEEPAWRSLTTPRREINTRI